MTDQDPTQRFEPPVPDDLPAAEASPPEPVPAVATPAAPPAPPMPAFEPVPTAPVTPTTGARPGRQPPQVARRRARHARWSSARRPARPSCSPATRATRPSSLGAGRQRRLRGAPRWTCPATSDAELGRVPVGVPGLRRPGRLRPVKLDEALDQLVGTATDGEQSLPRRHRAVVRRPARRRASARCRTTVETPTPPRALVLLSVKDGAKATAWIDGLVKAETGATDGHGDLQRRHDHHGAPPAGSGGEAANMKAAYAVLGPVLALGDLASVKAAIDTKGTAGLPTNDAVPGGRGLGHRRPPRVRVRGHGRHRRRCPEPRRRRRRGAAGPALDAPGLDDALGRSPRSRAEDGAFVVETAVAAQRRGGPAAERRVEDPGPRAADDRGPGRGPRRRARRSAQVKQQLASDPQLADAVKQVEDALGARRRLRGRHRLDRRGRRGRSPGTATRWAAACVVVSHRCGRGRPSCSRQLKAFLQLGGAQAGHHRRPTRPTAGRRSPSSTSAASAACRRPRPAEPSRRPAELSIAYAVTDEVVVARLSARTSSRRSWTRAPATRSPTTERFSTRAGRPARSTPPWPGSTSSASGASPRR